MNYEFNDSDKAMRSKLQGLFGPESEATLAGLGGLDPTEVRQTMLEWLVTLASAGYLQPRSDDGRNSVALVAAREVAAAGAPSLFLAVETSVRLFGCLLAKAGAGGEILESVLQGRAIGAVARGGTTANATDDGLELSGSARGVLNGPIADFVAVPVRMGDETFVAVVGAEGFFPGERESTLGFHGVTFSTLSFQGSLVPRDRVLGPLGGDIDALLASWQDEIHTAAALGIMQRCYDAAREQAKAPQPGGKPLIARQEVAFPLAEMLTLLDTSQLLAYRAAWLAETGDHEARVVGHTAKVFCTESALEVAGHALQILGEGGQVAGNSVEEGFRDSKYLQVAGTSVVQARLVIGDALLG